MQFVLTFAQSLTLSQRLLFFCAVYCSLAAVAFPETLLTVIERRSILNMGVVILFILMAGLFSVTLLNQPRSPIAFMRRRLVERGTGAAVIIVALFVSSSVFTSLKYEYSTRIPFFADSMLAAADNALHFGDPWQWLRAVLPAILDYPLFVLYSIGWFMEVILAVATAAFLTDRGLRERFLACFTIGVIVLSSAVRVFLNSAGPILYDRIHGGDRFAGLVTALQGSPSGSGTLGISDYLFTSYATRTEMLGTGISAMPSLHVALAFLNALFFARLGRLPRFFGWTYFGIVLFGSVYFGWHYALDGYVSIAVMAALWWVFGQAERDGAAA